MKEDKKGEVVGCLILFLILPLSAMWSGFVLSVLWRWFVLTTFESAPQLSIPAAIGLALVVRYLTNEYPYQRKDDKPAIDRTANAIGTAVLVPLFALGMGWVVHMFL